MGKKGQPLEKDRNIQDIIRTKLRLQYTLIAKCWNH